MHIALQVASLDVPMTRLLLVTVIGLPGCGKSTLSTELRTYLAPKQSCVWINFDALIPVEAFELDPLAETSDWRKWRLAITCCVERFILRHRQGQSGESAPGSRETDIVWEQVRTADIDPSKDLIILLDDNFYYSSMRRIIFNLAKRYNCGFAILECRCPIDVCLERNRHRPNPVPQLTIKNMAEKFEWTSASTNQWESHTNPVDCSQPFDEQTLKSIGDFFHIALEHPFNCSDEEELHRKQSRDRQINMDSVLHSVDNTLRSAVRSLILSKDPVWRKTNGKAVGDVKAHVLAEIRTLLSNASEHNNTVDAPSLTDYQDMAVTLFNRYFNEWLDQ